MYTIGEIMYGVGLTKECEKQWSEELELTIEDLQDLDDSGVHVAYSGCGPTPLAFGVVVTGWDCIGESPLDIDSLKAKEANYAEEYQKLLDALEVEHAEFKAMVETKDPGFFILWSTS